MSRRSLPRARRRPPLLPLLLSLVLSLGIVLGLPVRAAADGPTTRTNATAIAIPATNGAGVRPASPYPSTIDVSGMDGAVTKVTVSFNRLTHVGLGDVDAMVVAPNGTSNLVLLSDVGNPNQLVTITDQTLTFDDSAASVVPAQLTVTSGTYLPTNTNPGGATDTFPASAPTPSSQTTLAGAFTGLSSANGTWSLYVVDDILDDTGTMAGGWSIEITTAIDAVTTTTAVTSSDTTTTTGDPVTLTAAVRAGGTAVTAGSVQFSSDGTNLGGSVPLNGSGNATLTTRALTEGTHAIVAIYSGATGFLTSNGRVSQRVDNATAVNGTTYCNTGPITGPGTSAGEATPTPSNIFVTGLPGQVTKVTASLKGLSHTAPIDFDVLLSGPTPTTNVILLSDAGGQSTVSNLTVDFDDAAAGAVPNPLVSGDFRPTDLDPDGQVDTFPSGPALSGATALSTFDGGSANGTWSLWVRDDATGDVGSISGGWCLTIEAQSPTTTAVTATPNPSTFGQSVSLRAVVTSGGNPVTAGTVQFRDGATNLAPPVPVDGDGVATLTASALAVGSHTITAAYSGTAVLAESSGTVTQVVNRADSTTVLTSSLNPSDFGDLVTFTATVTAGGSPLTTGSVQFAVDGTDTGGPLAIDGSGQATFTTGGLAAGTHEITATHGGSTNYGPSGDDLDQVVNKLLTTTDLATSGSPSSFGQLVTFTANVTVTGDGDAATGGSVQFRDGTTDLGAPVAVIAGTATYDTATLTVGTHTITAAYLGTAALGTSSDSLDQVVGQALSTTVVSSSGTPSIFGDPVTFTAIVASGGQPVVGGTVQFLDGTTNLGGPVTVVAGGTATYQAEDLSVGTHPITATFSGTTEIAGSTSGTFDQVVEKAPTVVVLTTAPDPSTFGQLVTLTAEVTVGGVPLTEGTVAFSEGGTVFCEESALQSGGTATCPTDDLTVGAHTITATYSGTDDYAMNDDTDGHDVNQAATTVTLASSSNPAAYGLPVTFTATVSAGADPVGEGSVTIFVDGMPQQIDRDVDSAGQVTYTTSTLLAGSHTIRAEYSGSISYLASVSVDLQQQVEILADAGGPYEIAEGDSVTLDAAGSSPTGDYQWDLNDDGVFGDATGVDPTLTWAELESFGMDDGRSTPTSYPIAVQISSGAVRLVAASAIIVTNTAPAAIITGDLTATVGEPFTIKVGADDPSSADLTEQFTYTVDWGDGTPVFTVDGPADPPVTHTYSSAGEYAAQFTATDKDGGTGPGTTVTVLVAAAPTASPTPSPNPTTDDSYDSYDDDDTDSGSLASTGAVVGLGTILVGILLLGAGGAVLIASRRRTGRRAG